MFCKHSLQSASALANQSSRSQARAEGLPPLNHSTRVRPRRNGRAGICATRSKAPAVPRPDTDHTGPSISPASMPSGKVARASARRRFRAFELTGPLRPYGSAHFGPGLAMDTHTPIDTREEKSVFFTVDEGIFSDLFFDFSDFLF